MEIYEETIAENIILHLNGKLDIIASEELEEKALLIIEEGFSNIILDLQNLDYICSSGLRVLILVQKKLDILKKKLILANAQKPVKKVFRIVGFDSILSFADSIEDATKKLKN
jgi:anti-sigma B factor antagonist